MCTRLRSDSSRSSRASSRARSLRSVASQRSSASGAMPDAAASCSCSPRWSRFVIRRSPSLRASMRATTPSPAISRRYITANPRVRHSARYSTKRSTCAANAASSSVSAAMASGALSEDLRRQRRTHEVRARRLEHRGEHACDLVGVGRAEDALLRELDAADAERGERVLHVDALRVRAHEDGNVGRAQRHVVEADPLLRGLAQQPRDLRRRGAHCGGLRIGAQHRRAVCGRRQHPDGERRARRGVVREHRAMARPRGHRAIVELGEREGARIRAEQRVLRGDQRRCRALVLEQGEVRLRARARVRNTHGGRRCGSRRSIASDRRRGTPARRCPGRSLRRSQIAADRYPGTRRSARRDTARAGGRAVQDGRGFRARHGGCAADRRSRRRVRRACACGPRPARARRGAGSARDAHGSESSCSARRASRNAPAAAKNGCAGVVLPLLVHFGSRADVSRSSLSSFGYGASGSPARSQLVPIEKRPRRSNRAW